MGYGELDISQAETAGLFAAPAMFVTLRETLEAAIVLGVLIGLLNKLNLPHLKRYVYIGCATAGFLVVIFGIIVVLLISVAKESLFEGNDKHLIEGIVSIIAAVLIGFVAITVGDVMSLQHKIEAQMEDSIHEAHDIVTKKLMLFLSFTTVAREGLETIILFVPIVAAFETKAIPIPSFTGIIIGMIVGWLLFHFGGKLSIIWFMRVTMVVMIFIGAGVFVYGIGELQRTGAFGTWEPEDERPPLNVPIFDITDCCGLDNQFWVLMRVLFGYSPLPTPLEWIFYFSYHILIWSLLAIRLYRAKHGLPPMKKVIKYYLCYPCKGHVPLQSTAQVVNENSESNKAEPSKPDGEMQDSVESQPATIDIDIQQNEVESEKVNIDIQPNDSEKVNIIDSQTEKVENDVVEPKSLEQANSMVFN